MTLRTVTYDTATHKIVPLEPTTQIIQAAFDQNRSRKETKAVIPFGYELYLLGEAYLTMIAAAPEYQEPENPLDMPLPCDIKIGHGTIKKGCRLSTLVLRANVLYDLLDYKSQKKLLLNQEHTKDE